eukprot:a254_152.p2 GENE.a254_152~~a254_152.p2  ORF type:complete len:325 (+),score=116.85 a254_152:51-977(+)
MEKISRSLTKIQMPKGGSAVGTGLKLLAVGAAAVGLFTQCVYTVEGGHRAVVFSRVLGVKKEVKEPGMNFKIPFVDYPHIYDIRARPYNFTSLTGSKDLQMINVTLRVLAKPDTRMLPEIHQRLGPDYDERVLPSIVNEVLKAVVAQFNASQLVTMRSNVSLMVGKHLRRRAADFNILVDDASLTNLGFGTEYAHAVEMKKVAQQEAERAKILVEKAMQEKESAIIRATGEAKAATLIGTAASNNPGYLELQRLEHAREIAAIVARSGNQVYLNSDNLLLNLLATAKINLGQEGSPGEAPSNHPRARA